MNVYLTKFIVYYEIQRMHREGHSISQISEHLVLNRRTINKYLAMEEKEYEAFLVRQSDRKKALDAYEGFVKGRLERYPDTPAAQMHDWLKEFHTGFPQVNPKTIFNFVCYVREKHNLPRKATERQFQSIEELPYGQQAQVDFGEYNMRRSNQGRVKVFFFALVLSRSRFKYVWFSEEPFTSQLAIEAHEQAFEYIKGIPDEIVYDQDKVFIVSENNGDIILTQAFRAYTIDQSFQLHFCRKADPQSKGKVENVVKYIKQNFLYNRPFHDIETLNSETLGWMGRTANALPHAFTKKSPYDEWIIERSFLKPYQPCTAKEVPISQYTVRKDNTISYKGNFYSLPLGTYQGKGTKVVLSTHDGQLIIGNEAGKAEICRHMLAIGSGKKVVNTDHKRDKTAAIDQMTSQLCELLPDAEKGSQWLACIRKDKPRYIRDQIMVIKEVIGQSTPGQVAKTVDYCIENKINSASDFREILAPQKKVETKVVRLNPLKGSLPREAFNQPQTSHIEDYQSIIKNHKNNKQ
jgi:transposase